jgi:hypothetical protein
MIQILNFKITWYQLFKYCVYLAVSLNVYLFFREDLAVSSIIFAKGVSFKDIIVGYTGSIDTASWVILLIIFELQTYVIDDEKLKGGLQWVLKIISTICYVAISYSFYGFIKKFLWHLNFHEIKETLEICNHIGHSWLTGSDEYIPITAENCANLVSDGSCFSNGREKILTNTSNLFEAKKIALVDVMNSFAWLVVVIILEIDVWLQLRGKLKGITKKISTIVKIVAYTILIIAPVILCISGVILDFWDASLWIIAFIFIEMNIFKWQHGVKTEKITKWETTY